jgi:hypothetical protein
MATGRLSGVDITTTGATSVYTCPVTTFSVVSVSICNRTASAVTVNLALTTTGSTPATTDYLEFGASLSANGVVERTGIVIDAGKLIVVQTPTATPTLSVVVYGIETSTA